MFGHRYLNDIVYSPRDISRAKQVKEQVYQVMGKKYKFDPKDKDTLRMWDTIEMQEGFGKVSTGVRIFLGIIGGLTLIVAGVGLANIMYAVIRNRTREIGIKIAVGAKRRNIITEYILQSLLTVSAGGVIGLGFSWSLVKVINIIPLKQEAFQYLGRPVMSVTTALITAGVLGLVGFLAGIFPARRAASVNPVDALRYE
jgi:putative ABC transport system permease protein